MDMHEQVSFEYRKKRFRSQLPWRPIGKRVADEPGYSVWSPGSEFDRTRPEKVLDLLAEIRHQQDPVVTRAFFAALIEATNSNLQIEDLIDRHSITILRSLGIQLPEENADGACFDLRSDPTCI